MIIGIDREITAQALSMSQRQSESQSDALCQVAIAGKGLKQRFSFIIRQARTNIFNGVADGIFGISNAERNVLTIRIFGSIIQQLTQRAHQVNMISNDTERIGYG